jgi:hypothetical protein
MTLHWVMPGLLRDDNNMAVQGLTMLLKQRPALADVVVARRAIFVAFDLDYDAQGDVSLRDRIEALIPRFEVSYAGITPLWVAGSFASQALPLRALRYRPRKGYVLGTVAGAEGGMLFVSNVDDTVIVGPRWDQAEAFVMKALDDVLGPPEA